MPDFNKYRNEKQSFGLTPQQPVQETSGFESFAKGASNILGSLSKLGTKARGNNAADRFTQNLIDLQDARGSGQISAADVNSRAMSLMNDYIGMGGDSKELLQRYNQFFGDFGKDVMTKGTPEEQEDVKLLNQFNAENGANIQPGSPEALRAIGHQRGQNAYDLQLERNVTQWNARLTQMNVNSKERDLYRQNGLENLMAMGDKKIADKASGFAEEALEFDPSVEPERALDLSNRMMMYVRQEKAALTAQARKFGADPKDIDALYAPIVELADHLKEAPKMTKEMHDNATQGYISALSYATVTGANANSAMTAVAIMKNIAGDAGVAQVSGLSEEYGYLVNALDGNTTKASGSSFSKGNQGVLKVLAKYGVKDISSGDEDAHGRAFLDKVPELKELFDTIDRKQLSIDDVDTLSQVFSNPDTLQYLKDNNIITPENQEYFKDFATNYMATTVAPVMTNNLQVQLNGVTDNDFKNLQENLSLMMDKGGNLTFGFPKGTKLKWDNYNQVMKKLGRLNSAAARMKKVADIGVMALDNPTLEDRAAVLESMAQGLGIPLIDADSGEGFITMEDMSLRNPVRGGTKPTFENQLGDLESFANQTRDSNTSTEENGSPKA